jgi:hypothetical protein
MAEIRRFSGSLVASITSACRSSKPSAVPQQPINRLTQREVGAMINRVVGNNALPPRVALDRPLAAFLSAPPGPEQDCQNDRPNDAPGDPRDVWVSRLPFEDFLMDGH